MPVAERAPPCARSVSMKIKHVVVVALVASQVSACARENAQQGPPSVERSEQPGVGDPSDISPVTAEAWVDDVTVGKVVASNGSIAPDQVSDSFAAGEPIHV